MLKARHFLSLLLLQTASVWGQAPVSCITNQAPGDNTCADACLYCFLDGRTGHTAGYTAEPAPGFCGTVENNQWFGFVAGATDITIGITPSDCQSGDGIEIALYQNCSDAPIACVAGQPGDGTVTRTLSAPLDLGQTYFLMVDGYDGDHCAFQISASPPDAVALPSLASPGPVQGPSIVAPFSTLRYSIAEVPGATAYRWTGPAGSKINGLFPPVILSAPSGNQVTVTFGDQVGQLCVTPVDLCAYSPSCLNIAIGQTDLIPPCPANNFPAADLCADACAFCDFDGYAGTTAGYTGQTASGFCSGVQNEQWLAFVAGETSATFTCAPSNCANGNGIQMSLYASCDAPAPIACNEGQQGGGNTPISITAPLMPGVTYYLMIDGFGGDICDFELSVSPPSAAAAMPVGTIGTINGPSAICPGGTFDYSVSPVSGAGVYIWSGPPGSKINGFPTPATLHGAGGNVAQVTFGTQSGQVCVQAVNSCFDGPELCKTAILSKIPATVLPPVVVCNEDVPYVLPWGDMAYNSGVFEKTYQSSQGCDSIVRQNVSVKAPIIRFLPPRSICAGDSVVICGQAYTEAGAYTHTCTSFSGCDSLVNFSIIKVDPTARILPNQSLLCAELPLELSSSPSPGTKTWSTLSGQVLGSGNSIQVTIPDTYVLTTTANAGAETCEASDTIQVVSGMLEASATGGIITCAQPALQLGAAANASGALFAWSGPSGFASDVEAPVVDQPGTYILVVTDPATGCTAQTTALVLADLAVPTISVQVPMGLNCTIPDIALGCPPLPPGGSCAWSGPGISSPIPNPVVDSPGVYLLTVTGPNGCTSTSELAVTADFQIPVITVYADTITCLNTTAMIHCEVDIPMSACDWAGAGPGYVVTATAPNGCTATATVSVPIDTNVPNVSTAGDTLRCDKPNATLQASTDVPNALFAWSGPGGFTSTEQNPTVTQAGQYFVTVTNPLNGCSIVALATVLAEDDVPLVLIASPVVLSCAKTSVVLHATSNIPATVFLWNGPNGFSSTQPNPEVDAPGMYMLIATNPASGCSAVATVEVVEDIQTPEVSLVQVVSDQNGQGLGAIFISVVHTGPYAVVWYHNGQVIFNQENISGLKAGDYTVVATGSNGCTDTLTVTVPDTGVSAPELSNEKHWVIYPNPTSNHLFLRYLGPGLPEAHVQLLDATGRLVLEQDAPFMTEITVSCGHLPPGIYTVFIRTREAVVRRLVAVQR